MVKMPGWIIGFTNEESSSLTSPMIASHHPEPPHWRHWPYFHLGQELHLHLARPRSPEVMPFICIPFCQEYLLKSSSPAAGFVAGLAPVLCCLDENKEATFWLPFLLALNFSTLPTHFFQCILPFLVCTCLSHAFWYLWYRVRIHKKDTLLSMTMRQRPYSLTTLLSPMQN